MLDSEYERLSRHSELAKYLDSSDLEMMASHSKIITFSTGQVILQQGRESRGIFLIIDGEVISTAKLLGAGTTNLESLGPGSFLGDVSYIEGTPCSTSIIANSSVKCVYIDDVYMNMLTTYYPGMKYKLLNAIAKQACERLKKVHDKVTDSMSSADMTKRSVFGEIMHSLTRPAETPMKLTEVNIDAIKKSEIFKLFSQGELDELFNHVAALKAPKNCTIIRKGEKNASCYIVIQGAVQSSVMHENKIAKLSVIGPGTLFASISCIDNITSFVITFTTCESAVLLRISDDAMLHFKNAQTTLWYKLFDLICKSLLALEKSVDKLDIRLNIEDYNR
ncbi:hypothetical protein AQUSIP_25120 [Aquicella siphonis]|uniref:Cyclic nucleotide-binding domain-containing protein n=1 Tax=Aquicella siphonis TaxID=254247 RepID=A0A5E4PKW6_9COXI|nr:cyclic nucleotide-binding domain-containing protein [Aquicella siphonis]VVC77185.1 hypothetical protein AQUSIP_25120 [Aquicella siphonis]